jgi:lipid-A-disaccharide synthase
VSFLFGQPILDSQPPIAQPDLLIVAGEHSGDQHAAKLVQRLLKQYPHLNIYALGGPALKAAGAHLLVDMTQFAVLGVAEVIKNILFFWRLHRETFKWIRTYKPKHIVLVDYPGFNLNLAKTLHKHKLSHKAGGPINIHYYISPQIWAWKAYRRFKMAETLDSLGVIFPFEVDCYKDTSLDVHFVGHPFIEEDNNSIIQYDPNGPVLILPGSRKGTLKYNFPAMLHILETLFKQKPSTQALVVYPTESIRKYLQKILDQFPQLISNVTLTDKQIGLKAKAVLTGSGTMSFRCAMAGIPGVIVYKGSQLNYWIAKRVVKVNYLGLNNILLNAPMYPEFYQHNATPDNVLPQLIDCLDNPKRLEQTKQQAQQIISQLQPPPNKSQSADQWLAHKMGLL